MKKTFFNESIIFYLLKIIYLKLLRIRIIVNMNNCLFKKVCIPYNLIRQNKQKGIPMKQYNSNHKKR